MGEKRGMIISYVKRNSYCSIQILDFSDDPNEPYRLTRNVDLSVRRIVRKPEIWPDMTSLDISGRPLESPESEKIQGEYTSLQVV